MIDGLDKTVLIRKLLANDIQPGELRQLREAVTAEDLSLIIQKIYDLNESYILKLAAVEGILDRMNRLKNRKRNARFVRKIRNGFRDPEKPGKMIVVAEGDSWFNYPVILTDIVDQIAMDPDLAVYSVASGGDWLLNMLMAREYVQELSVLHPHVFLISGGGNDLVGARRLATIMEPKGNCQEYGKNQWAQDLVKHSVKDHVPFQEDVFTLGCRYLSKDFFALLMFFHLQYYFLINGILLGGRKEPKFGGIKIITQGYDYPIPSYSKGFGINPVKWYIPFIRSFLGHGGWLKTPLHIRGILNEEVQRSILYAMIYLFNEMMIEMGTGIFGDLHGLKDRVFHIDSRNSLGEKGWTDELHPKPAQFAKTGKAFVDCIKGSRGPTYGQVYVVSKM